MPFRLSSVAAGIAAISLCVSPSVASASSTMVAASTTSAVAQTGSTAGVAAALAQGCAASVSVAAAAAAQAVRPGCVLPAVGNQPVVAQTVAPDLAPGGLGIGFPILAGLAAALLGAYFLLKGDNGDSDGDLSPG